MSERLAVFMTQSSLSLILISDEDGPDQSSREISHRGTREPLAS